MKTVHLTNAYHSASGGLRTMYAGLLQAANRLRREACLVVPSGETRIEHVGDFGRIYHLAARPAPFDSRYRLLLPTRFLFDRPDSVVRILREEQPDVLEICDKFTLFYIAGLLRKGWMRGVPRPTLIGSSAERFEDSMAAFVSERRPARAWARWYMRAIYTPMFDYHVANSEYTAGEIREALPQHRREVVHVMTPGVDLESLAGMEPRPVAGARLRARHGLSADDTILFYAGRLSPEKHLDLLVGTLGALIRSADGSSYHLLVAGDGPMRRQLEDEAAQRTPGRVHFLGNIERQALAGCLAGADVFIHPNPREPFGIAPLEAMAAGLPLVAPSAGGVLSYADERSAWLVDATAASFAQAVQAALRDGDRQMRVALARQRAEQFAMPSMTSRLFQLFDRLHHERLHGTQATEGADETSAAARRRARILADS